MVLLGMRSEQQKMKYAMRAFEARTKTKQTTTHRLSILFWRGKLPRDYSKRVKETILVSQ